MVSDRVGASGGSGSTDGSHASGGGGTVEQSAPHRVRMGSDPEQRHRRVWCPLLFGLLSVLPYASLLTSGDLVLKDGPYADYGSFQLPVREFVRAELFTGRFPHWIPWLGCGIPLHAGQQVGICYPLCTPLLYVLETNMAVRTSLLIHAILCYWGQYRVSRQLGISPDGSGLSGLAATWSGFFCTHLAVGHVSLVFAYALIPWLLSSVIEVCQTTSRRACCRFAIVVGLLLLIGQPQVPYYALLFAGIWALASVIMIPGGLQRLRALACFLIGLCLGIAVAAIQLLPAYELFRDNQGMSGRASTEFAATYALEGVDLIRFFVPSLLGNPLVDIPEFRGPDFYHEKVVYPGILCLTLAAVGLCRNIRGRWRWGAAGLIVSGLVIALGDSTPLFSGICGVIPGLTWFRCPGRCLSVAAILLALLAGRGFDALAESTPARSFRSELRLTVCVLLLLNAVAWIVVGDIDETGFAGWTSFASTHLKGEIPASVFALTVSPLVLLFTRGMSSHYRVVVLSVVLLMDVSYFNVRCIRFERDRIATVMEGSGRRPANDRFLDGDTGFRSDQVRYSRMVPDAVRGRFRMIGTNEGGILPAACEVAFLGLERNQDPFLRLSGCRRIISRSGPGTRILPDSFPRIWFCPEELAATLDLSVTDISREVVDALAASAGNYPVNILSDDVQHLQMEVSTDRPGVLVIADTWYPIWTGLVNGAEVPVRKTFQCFRGIAVSPGRSHVTLTCTPQSFTLGYRISIAASVLLCLMWNLRTGEARVS